MQRHPDFPIFVQRFNRLAMALPDPNPDPSGVKVEAYFEALSEWGIGVVESAAQELARTGGAFFPSSSVWWEACRLQALKQGPYSGSSVQTAFGPAKPAMRLLPAAEPSTQSGPRAPLPNRALAIVDKLFPRDKVVCLDCGITVSDPEHKPECPKVMVKR